jgi:ribosomal protein S12 methylthiotransferase accessory factor
LCEALERASSVWQGDELVRLGSRASLNEQSLPFGLLQDFSERQYRDREQINRASVDRRRQVPRPCEEETVIGWTLAWPLNGGDPRWVPLAYCFAETPRELGSDYGIYNPNGTAAGNCLEEAVLHGLLELVERDATAIWWYNQVPRPEVCWELIEDAFVARLRQQYAQAGWRVRVLDITHDLGIPVYVGVARHERTRRWALGFGCHLDPSVAAIRALTELNQLMDSRDGAPAPWDESRLREPAFLEPALGRAGVDGSPSRVDLKEAIALCSTRLARANLQAFCVDKTRPDLGLSVAQVIVPGLRHFWPRFATGRLYDVPVAMGWRTAPNEEASLNPAPLFL